MMRTFTLFSIFGLSRAFLVPEKATSLSLLQIDTSVSNELVLNESVKVAINSHVQFEGLINRSEEARLVQHEGQAKPIISWISGAILVVVFASLLCHMVPMLLNFSRRHSVDDENDALEGGATEAATSLKRTVVPVLLYGALYIVCSCTLIKYNKFLMGPGRFPYAVNLTFGHQISGSIFLFILYKLKPSLYPSLTDPGNSGKISGRTFVQGFLPIAACFSGQLVLSNLAYVYTSVAFLQMMKEGNMVLVYLFSLMAGLEGFHSVRARVLLCLLLSTALTIQGELSFSLTGFAVQGTSQLMESTKIVLQSVLLSAAGTGHLDPYSYNLLVQPTVAFLLNCFMCIAVVYLPFVSIAPWAEYAIWWPHLLANCAVALSLNIVVSLFIAHSSAVGFIICGIAKDVVLILADVLIFGTEVSHLQVFAFGLQILFVSTYSLLKTFSKQLEPPKASK